MTCASCAARVEKKLHRMDGVSATVNDATEKAKVTFGARTDRARRLHGRGAQLGILIKGPQVLESTRQVD
ncbi:MAG: heavy metal translocating P-type ATPase, partial [Cellulomonas sp.]|nr:heavy metal translocating P-type ATPase [Cellulomonas sp.]